MFISCTPWIWAQERNCSGTVTITASVVVNGKTYTFIDKVQQQRPGLFAAEWDRLYRISL